MDWEDKKDKCQKVIINKSFMSTAGLITILLVILKLTHNIDISWLWVFAAYWLPIVIVFGFVGIFLIGATIVALIVVIAETYESKKK